METEKSNSSSFEDLSNDDVKESSPELQSTDIKKTESETISASAPTTTTTAGAAADSDQDKDDNGILDILGNGQLTKRTVQKGKSEEQPQRGDCVKINYSGKLDNGTVIEDEENFELHVGDFEVVQGLDMALPLMQIGEVAEIIVDVRFGYGSIGLKNESKPSASIPSDARITYTVELLEIKSEEESEVTSFEQRKKFGNRKRERANFWYNRNEFNIAIQIYRRALEYLDDTDGGITTGKESELTNSQLQELLEDRLVVYNNLAIAQIKISAFDAALKSVDNVLRCQPNNSKALYRKGRIMDAKGDTKSAITLLRKAATLEPDSKTIQQVTIELSKLIMKSRREERNEKEMYQKMLGQAKKLEQKNHKATHDNGDIPKLKMLGYVMGSILIGVAGVAMYRYKYF